MHSELAAQPVARVVEVAREKDVDRGVCLAFELGHDGGDRRCDRRMFVPVVYLAANVANRAWAWRWMVAKPRLLAVLRAESRSVWARSGSPG